MKVLRFVALVVTMFLAATTIGTPPAAADAPSSFDFSDTFPAVNPCTGEPHLVTINFFGRVHEHGDREVVVIHRTGSTSDGYAMDNSVVTQVANGQVIRGTLNDQWRGADGSAYRVRGVFVLAQGDLRVDRFALECRRR